VFGKAGESRLFEFSGPVRGSLLTALALLVGAAGCAPATSGVVAGGEGSNSSRVAMSQEEVTLQIASGTLYGTLLVPTVTTPGPVALIIAGSGPTDRDGNNPLLAGPNNSLKLLAEALADEGIATVRYDKRGIAASAAAAAREEDVRFYDFVGDAAAWVRLLQADPRFSSVTVIGHSEGSGIGAAATGEAGADAYVSISGIARRASDVLRDQLRPQLPPILWVRSERILAELEAGRTTDDVPDELMAIYRPSVQPYLISWFRLDPVATVGALEVPVLIAHGTTDTQVAVTEADSLRSGRPDAQLAIIEGMNHVLKLVSADPAEQAASYSNPDLPVAPALVSAITAFIHDVDK
jgi:alpha-beta hydrolase superfamily lysophospholipase